MSEAIVQELLQRIDQLPAEDRRVLEERLAERAETEWRQLAQDARRVAKSRGLDQAAIDAAVERVRHSK